MFFSPSRLTFYAVIFGLAWLTYIGWQLSDLYADQPLPPERISAKQLRVNETGRRALMDTITTYTTAPAPATVPSPAFTTAPKS
jgi:hypothetical protein